MPIDIARLRRNLERQRHGRYSNEFGPSETILSDSQDAGQIPILSDMDNWSMDSYRYELGDKGQDILKMVEAQNPTLRIVRATGVSHINLYDEQGQIQPFKALEQRGLKIEQPQNVQTGKRLSRLFRRSYAYGTFPMSEMSFTEFGDKDTTEPWDGMNLISRQAVEILTKNLPEETRKKYMQSGRFSGTVMAGGQYGGYQYKGDWLVRDIEDMPGGAMIAAPYGSAKKNISYNPFQNSIFAEIRPQVAHNDPLMDVQSLVNWGHPLVDNEQLQGFLQLQSDQFLQSLREGKGTEMALRQYSHISSQEQWDTRMKDPLYRFLASGGRLEESPSMLRKFADMRTKSLIGKNFEGMRLPVKGMFRLYMANALTSDNEDIRNLAPGQAYADYENASLFVNQTDWSNTAETLGGGDQDDAVNILLNKTGQIIAARTPNASGEYKSFELVNAAQMSKYGIHALDTDFSRLDQVTQIGHKVNEGPLPKGTPPASADNFVKFGIWQMRQAAKNIAVLGQHIKVLSATTLATGREQAEQPADLEDVIDSAQKNVGSDLTRVKTWDKATAAALQQLPLPKEAINRIKGFFPLENRQFKQSKGHWIDELFSWTDKHANWFIGEVEKIANQASLPKEAISQVRGNELGNALSSFYFASLNDEHKGARTDEDYTRARRSTVSYLNSMDEEDRNQSILQALVHPMTTQGNLNDRFLWSGDVDDPEQDLSALTFKALRHYGVLGEAKYGDEIQSPDRTSAKTLIVDNALLQVARRISGKNYKEWKDVPLSFQERAQKAISNTKGLAGRSFNVQDGSLIDETGIQLGDISELHMGAYEGLTAGRIDHASVKDDHLVLSISDYQINQEEVGMIDLYKMDQASQNLYDFVRKVKMGKATLDGLPASYRSSVRAIIRDIQSAEELTPTQIRSRQAINNPTDYARGIANGSKSLEDLDTEARYLVTELANKMGANLPTAPEPETVDFGYRNQEDRYQKTTQAKRSTNTTAIQAANYLTGRMIKSQIESGRKEFTPRDFGNLWRSSYFAASKDEGFFEGPFPELSMNERGEAQITRTFSPEGDFGEIAGEKAAARMSYMERYAQNNPAFGRIWGFDLKASAPGFDAADPAERWSNTPDDENPFWRDYAVGGGAGSPPPPAPPFALAEPPDDFSSGPPDFGEEPPADLNAGRLRYETYPQFRKAKANIKSGRNALYVAPTGSGKSDLIKEVFRGSGGINIDLLPSHALAGSMLASFEKTLREDTAERGNTSLGQTFYLRGHPGAFDPDIMDREQYDADVAKYQSDHQAFYDALWRKVEARRGANGSVQNVTGWKDDEPINVIMSYEKFANLDKNSRLGKTLSMFGRAGLVKNIAIDEAHELTTPSRQSSRQLMEAADRIAPGATVFGTSATLSQYEAEGMKRYLRADEINHVPLEFHPDYRLEVYAGYKRNDYGQAIQSILEKEGRPPALVFAPSVDEVLQFDEQLKDAGFNSVPYHRDPSRPLPKEVASKAEARFEDSPLAPGDITVSTAAAKAGISNLHIPAVIAAGRGGMHDFVQELGRVRTNPKALEVRGGDAGYGAMVVDPEYFAKGATDYDKAIEKLPQYMAKAFMEAKEGRYLQEGQRYSRNWQIASQQIQESVRLTLKNFKDPNNERDKGIYPYFASELTSMFAESGLIELAPGGDEGSGGDLNWKFADVGYSGAHETLIGAQYKNPLAQAENISFSQYQKVLGRKAREYSLLSRMFKGMVHADPAQAGREFMGAVKDFYSFDLEASAPSMLRLYRGERDPEVPPTRPVPDWLKEDPKYKAQQTATGRWFTQDRSLAEWYKDDVGEHGIISQVDLPADEAEQYRLVNQPKEIQRWSADLENEYFLPPDIASKRVRAEAPGHERMGLVLTDGTNRSTQDVAGWSHPSSFEAYPTEVAKAIADAALKGKRPVGTVHTEPQGTPDRLSQTDHDLPGETFVAKEGMSPKRMKAEAARDPLDTLEDTVNVKQPKQRYDAAADELNDIFTKLISTTGKLSENFEKFSKTISDVGKKVEDIPQAQAMLASRYAQLGSVTARGGDVELGQAYTAAAGLIDPTFATTGGGQIGGIGAPPGDKDTRPAGGGGIMRDPISRALYGVYMARRMWQYTAAESFQNAMYASRPGMGLAIGAPESDLYGGYAARAGLAREASGRATLDAFGGFMDLGNMAQGNPFMGQAIAGVQVGAGIGFGAIEMGLNLQQSGFFMDQMKVEGAESLMKLGGMMTKGGLIVGGLIAATNIGMAATNAITGKEGRTAYNTPNILRNWSYLNAVNQAANDKNGFSAARFTESVLQGIPRTFFSGSYEWIGEYAERQGVTYEDMQGAVTPNGLKYAQVQDRTEEQKQIRKSAEDLVNIYGGSSDDYTPLITALGRGTPGGPVGFNRVAKGMLAAANNLNYSPQEYATEFLTTARQRGIQPWMSEYGDLAFTFEQLAEAKDHEGFAEEQLKGERTGQLAGQLSPYMGYSAAARLVETSGITTQAQAQSLAGIMGTYQTYGGTQASPAQIAKYVTGFSAPVLSAAGDLSSSFLQMGGSPDQYLGVMGGVAGFFQQQGYNQHQMSLAGSILGGNLQAASYASYKYPDLLSNMGMSGTRFFDQSMNPIYETSGQDFISLLRSQQGLASAQKYTGYTSLFGGGMTDQGIASYLGVQPGRMDTYLSQGVRGVQREIKADLWQNTLASFSLQREQLGEQTSYMTSMWGYEDQLRGLSHRSAMAGFDATFKRMTVSNDFSIQQENLSWDRMQANHEYQRWQLGQEKESNVLQRQWAREDWAYQDQTRNLQWGWKQEDYAEESRFMTGRQRRLADRQMKRDTIMHNLEGDQIETQRDRQETLWNKEDQRYTKQAEYAEKLMALDEEQWELNKNQRETMFEMEMEEFNRRKAEYLEEKKIRDEITKLERDHQKKSLEFQEKSLQLSEKNAKLQKELEDVINKNSQAWSDIRGELEAINSFDNPQIVLEAIQSMLSATGSVDPKTVESITNLIKGIGTGKETTTTGYQYSYEPKAAGGGSVVPTSIKIYIGNEKLEDYILDVVEGDMR